MKSMGGETEKRALALPRGYKELLNKVHCVDHSLFQYWVFIWESTSWWASSLSFESVRRGEWTPVRWGTNGQRKNYSKTSPKLLFLPGKRLRVGTPGEKKINLSVETMMHTGWWFRRYKMALYKMGLSATSINKNSLHWPFNLSKRTNPAFVRTQISGRDGDPFALVWILCWLLSSTFLTWIQQKHSTALTSSTNTNTYATTETC